MRPPLLQVAAGAVVGVGKKDGGATKGIRTGVGAASADSVATGDADAGVGGHGDGLRFGERRPGAG